MFGKKKFGLWKFLIRLFSQLEELVTFTEVVMFSEPLTVSEQDYTKTMKLISKTLVEYKVWAKE